MNEHPQLHRSSRKLAIEALENMRSDDLERARRHFRHLSNLELDQQYGQSDKTPRQILAEYEAREERVNAAIAWVKEK